MINKKLYLLLIVLALLIPKLSCAQESWSQLLENTSNAIPEIELKDKNNSEQLISHYEIGDKQEILSLIDLSLDKKYNSALISIYLLNSLSYGNEDLSSKTKSRLESFRTKDSMNSSIPDFLLSYYYFLKSDYPNATISLKNANKINKYNDFTKERKKSSFRYLIQITNSKIYSYNHSSFITTGIPYFLLRMTREIDHTSNKEFNNELIAFANILKDNSTNLYELTSSIQSKLNCIDKTDTPELYASEEKESNQIPKMLNHFSDSFDNAEGKEEFVKYLEIAYECGELEAINTYFPYKYDKNIDIKKETDIIIKRITNTFDQLPSAYESTNNKNTKSSE